MTETFTEKGKEGQIRKLLREEIHWGGVGHRGVSALISDDFLFRLEREEKQKETDRRVHSWSEDGIFSLLRKEWQGTRASASILWTHSPLLLCPWLSWGQMLHFFLSRGSLQWPAISRCWSFVWLSPPQIARVYSKYMDSIQDWWDLSAYVFRPWIIMQKWGWVAAESK